MYFNYEIESFKKGNPMRTWEEVLATLKSSPRWEDIKKYLEPYFYRRPQLEEIWSIMDQVWNDMVLDNKNYSEKELGEYYSHPVWLLNGLWIETDPVSMQHRKGMAKYVEGENPKVLDYGGGLGTLAKQIAYHCQGADIEIYEPHASNIAHDNISNFDNIKILDKLNKRYDYIFSSDVFEHVEKPTSLIISFNRHLKTGGFLIAAWNFTSCIKCHLPNHFHFRYTMHRWIIPSLGFLYVEKAKGGHGHVFKKVKETDGDAIKKVYKLTFISKAVFPIFRSLSFGKVLVRNATALRL